MTGTKTAQAITFVAAAGYFATAGLHATGYDSVTALAGDGPADLRVLVPALWLSFSLDLVIIGFILSVVALRPGFSGAPLIVASCGLAPLGAAVLQLVYLGFIPPTAILLAIAALTFTAAVFHRRAGT